MLNQFYSSCKLKMIHFVGFLPPKKKKSRYASGQLWTFFGNHIRRSNWWKYSSFCKWSFTFNIAFLIRILLLSHDRCVSNNRPVERLHTRCKSSCRTSFISTTQLVEMQSKIRNHLHTSYSDCAVFFKMYGFEAPINTFGSKRRRNQAQHATEHTTYDEKNNFIEPNTTKY
jgi:hypothetical protein